MFVGIDVTVTQDGVRGLNYMHYLCMELACHGSDAGYDKVEKYVRVYAGSFQVNAIGTFKDYR